MNEQKMREALVRVRELLTNMQPHIEQACYPGKAAFIDNYVAPCLETIAKAIDQQQVIAPIEQRILALRNQLASDINRPDGRWGMHGHSCVDDDYFQALYYVVGRIDEALAQPAESGRQLYDRLTSDDKPESAIEALRFFLSLSLDGQDWLDVEPFLDAVAQQPTAVVELTDEEIAKIGCSAEQATECEGYENNTLWFNGNLTDFARAVIAAHEAKKSGGGA